MNTEDWTLVAVIILWLAGWAGETAYNRWLLRTWRRTRDEANDLIAKWETIADEADRRAARANRDANDAHHLVQTALLLNELTNQRREHWVTMTADQKERHLAVTRQVIDAAHEMMLARQIDGIEQ